MLAPYPRAADFRQTPMPTGRSRRSRRSCSASARSGRARRTALACHAGVRALRADGDAAALAALAPAIARVANLESVTVIESEADLPPCAIAIVDGRSVLARSPAWWTTSREISRLDKRRAKAQQERERCAPSSATRTSSPTPPRKWSPRSRRASPSSTGSSPQLGEQRRRLAALQPGGESA